MTEQEELEAEVKKQVLSAIKVVAHSEVVGALAKAQAALLEGFIAAGFTREEAMQLLVAQAMSGRK